MISGWTARIPASMNLLGSKNEKGAETMYHPRHLRKKSKNPFIVLLPVLALSLLLTIGATLAFLSTKTDSLKNTFHPTEITCDIEEKFDGKLKENVQIRNTGTAPAYIRASVMATWVNSDGSVAAEKPIEGTDYQLTYAENTGWFQGSDGYWYYTSAVTPGNPTGILIQKCTQTTEKTGCKLAVEILASAVQSEPTEAVTNAWAVTVNPDGIISK